MREAPAVDLFPRRGRRCRRHPPPQRPRRPARADVQVARHAESGCEDADAPPARRHRGPARPSSAMPSGATARETAFEVRSAPRLGPCRSPTTRHMSPLAIQSSHPHARLRHRRGVGLDAGRGLSSFVRHRDARVELLPAPSRAGPLSKAASAPHRRPPRAPVERPSGRRSPATSRGRARRAASFLCHLSEVNNEPELALRSVRERARDVPVEVLRHGQARLLELGPRPGAESGSSSTLF